MHHTICSICMNHRRMSINSYYSSIQSTPSNSILFYPFKLLSSILRFKLIFSLNLGKMTKSTYVELGEQKTSNQMGNMKRGVSVLDFILRLIAIVCTLASAIAMGTTDESLPFFTQFVRFRANYDDLPTLRYICI